MSTTNPLFRDLGIPQLSHERALAISERMTLVGTLHKTGVLLALFAISTALGWKEFRLFVLRTLADQIGISRWVL